MNYPNRRPKAPAKYWENWSPDNRIKSRTEVEIEPCACDSFKVILEMCHQLCDIERMQNEDIYAIIKADLEQYGGMLEGVIYPRQRPEADDDYWENWDSDNFYTATDIKVEYCARDCFNVILQMCIQIMEHEGLSVANVLAVVWSDLERHIIWNDQ